eukprot:scaffold25696_cov66-Phaeocystis_antarctica.AAC.7
MIPCEAFTRWREAEDTQNSEPRPRLRRTHGSRTAMDTSRAGLKEVIQEESESGAGTSSTTTNTTMMTRTTTKMTTDKSVGTGTWRFKRAVGAPQLRQITNTAGGLLKPVSRRRLSYGVHRFNVELSRDARQTAGADHRYERARFFPAAMENRGFDPRTSPVELLGLKTGHVLVTPRRIVSRMQELSEAEAGPAGSTVPLLPATHAATPLTAPQKPARLLGATLQGPRGAPSPRRCRREAGAAATPTAA